MVKINLSPILMSGKLEVLVERYKLTVCSEIFDFTPLPVGYELSLGDIGSPLFGDKAVMHTDGTLEVTLLLPYSDPDAPISVRFPESILVSTDGPVILPRQEEVANEF